MTKDKLTLDLEKIKEVHELKEGCKYVVVAPKVVNSVGCIIANVLKAKFKIKCVVINTPIKIYEVKESIKPEYDIDPNLSFVSTSEDQTFTCSGCHKTYTCKLNVLYKDQIYCCTECISNQ